MHISTLLTLIVAVAGQDVPCLQKGSLVAQNGVLDITSCLVESNEHDIKAKTEDQLRQGAINNTATLNYILKNLGALLHNSPSPRIVMRSTDSECRFLLQGGVEASHLANLTLQLDGTLDYGACLPSNSANCKLKMENYPGFSWKEHEADTVPMMRFTAMSNFKITSSIGKGRIMGGGQQWYGLFSVLRLGDTRGRTKPRMLDMGHGDEDTTDGLEISYISLEQAAYWTTYLKANNVHIHHSNITARKIQPEVPGPLSDPSAWVEELYRINAWNTDGFDITGDNVHIHDCHIQNSDDCVAVKGGSNWVVERIFASGAGMTIGSEGHAHNITFRDIVMEQSIHGLYVKTHASDVTFENVHIKEAFLFPIWVGPPWQELSGGCPLLWPFLPTGITASISKLTGHDMSSICHPGSMEVTNLKFKNITLDKAHSTPVVLFGGKHTFDVSFEDFKLGEGPSHAGSFPWTSKPACYNTSLRQPELVKPGALFEACGDTEVCTKSGKRDAMKPCCDESAAGYNHFRGGRWGLCKDPKQDILI